MGIARWPSFTAVASIKLARINVAVPIASSITYVRPGAIQGAAGHHPCLVHANSLRFSVQVLRIQRSSQEYVVVEVEEPLGQLWYAVQKCLDGRAGEGGQLVGIGSQDFVGHHRDPFVAEIQPTWNLAIGYYVHMPDPCGVFFQGPQRVPQLILVIEPRGIVLVIESPDVLNKVGIRAIDSRVNRIDGSAGAAEAAGLALLRCGQIVGNYPDSQAESSSH